MTGGVNAARGGHVGETRGAVAAVAAVGAVRAVVVVVMRGEVGVAGGGGTACRDGGSARVADGAWQGGERGVLLVRVVRVLVGALWPRGVGHGEAAYGGEGGVVAVVVILCGSLAGRLGERAACMTT